jgi:hypothetical protein
MQELHSHRSMCIYSTSLPLAGLHSIHYHHCRSHDWNSHVIVPTITLGAHAIITTVIILMKSEVIR